mgnify:CR=1 FL=1
MPEQEFAGRVALVTGGSRGIGRAICLRLAQSGARVAINYAANEAAALETKALVEAAGGEANIFQAKVEDPEAVSAMVQAVERQLGSVDLLVTSAGIVAVESHPEMKFEVWQRVMRVNLDGTYLPVMAVKDSMIERGYGRIVCITSIAGLRPRPTFIAYSSSKAAVIGFVRSCSEAFAPDVRINAIAPGFVKTPHQMEFLDISEERKKIEAMHVMPIQEASDIAELAVFLASEKARTMTGGIYPVDSGYSSVKAGMWLKDTLTAGSRD